MNRGSGGEDKAYDRPILKVDNVDSAGEHQNDNDSKSTDSLKSDEELKVVSPDSKQAQKTLTIGSGFNGVENRRESTLLTVRPSNNNQITGEGQQMRRQHTAGSNHLGF